MSEQPDQNKNPIEEIEIAADGTTIVNGVHLVEEFKNAIEAQGAIMDPFDLMAGMLGIMGQPIQNHEVDMLFDALRTLPADKMDRVIDMYEELQFGEHSIMSLEDELIHQKNITPEGLHFLTNNARACLNIVKIKGDAAYPLLRTLAREYNNASDEERKEANITTIYMIALSKVTPIPTTSRRPDSYKSDEDYYF